MVRIETISTQTTKWTQDLGITHTHIYIDMHIMVITKRVHQLDSKAWEGLEGEKSGREARCNSALMKKHQLK